MPNPFPDKLDLSPAGMKGGSRLFVLNDDFRFVGNATVIVPAGFVTDGASIPRLFWSLMGPFGLYFEAAIVHDFLYSTGGCGALSRLQCDLIFLEAMTAIGVSWLTRSIIYRAVRIGAASHFQTVPVHQPH
jgi:hypothetical protein